MHIANISDPVVPIRLEEQLATSSCMQDHALLDPAVLTHIILNITLASSLSNHHFAHALRPIVVCCSSKLWAAAIWLEEAVLA